ncbi:hypothetical protein [Pedobacter chinensis]|nr:hypothetical protein [Pedobacter chinensis]
MMWWLGTMYKAPNMNGRPPELVSGSLLTGTHSKKGAEIIRHDVVVRHNV